MNVMLMLSLFLCCILSMGVHFSRASFTIFAVYMIDTTHFITPGQYSVLTTVSFIPSLFVPLFIGLLLDKNKNIETREKSTIVFIFITIIAQLLLAYSVSIVSYHLAILSQLLFGIGACSLVLGQRTLIVQKFKVSLYFLEFNILSDITGFLLGK